MRVIVTGQRAGVGSTRVGDWVYAIRGDDVEVKVDKPLSRNRPAKVAHSMSRVASGAGKTVIDVARMLAERRISHDLIHVVALPAEGVRPIDGQIRIGKKIGDQLAGQRSLAELITAL